MITIFTMLLDGERHSATGIEAAEKRSERYGWKRSTYRRCQGVSTARGW